MDHTLTGNLLLLFYVLSKTIYFHHCNDSYETGDGSVREETGVVKNAGTDEAYVAQSGFYKYIDADGSPVEVHYTADENGFVPYGTNILDAITAAAKAAANVAA